MLTFFIGAVMRLNCFPELLMPSRQQRLCDKANLENGLSNWGRRSPGFPDLQGALETADQILCGAHLRTEYKLKIIIKIFKDSVLSLPLHCRHTAHLALCTAQAVLSSQGTDTAQLHIWQAHYYKMLINLKLSDLVKHYIDRQGQK